MKFRLINAIIISLSISVLLSASDSVPYRKSRYINDYASVINDKNAGEIMLLLKKFEKRTGIEASILTIGSSSDYTAGKEGVDALAANALSEWKLKKGGILLLVAVNDRRLKVELGQALAESGEEKFQEIINNVIVPYFKAGDYSAGIYEGAKAMTQSFSSHRNGSKTQGPELLVFILIGGAVLLFALAGISFVLGRDKTGKQFIKQSVESEKKGYGGGSVGNW